jgi:IS5 family transposase
MATDPINHLSIRGSVPKLEGLEYLEQVEATFELYGARGRREAKEHERRLDG